MLIRKGETNSIVPLLLEGQVTEYYMNGNVKSISIFEQNQLISNKNWLENGIEYFDNIYYSVDRYPVFVKGNDVLNKHIMHVLKLNRVDYSALTGKLIIGFVVFEDGQIGGFKIVKGINQRVEELVVHALRTLKGDWQPAQLNGKKVRFFQKFPINFIHDNFQVEFFDFYSGMVQIERE
ncbi:MAG: energy transducer TonB [Prolixibacteraceae bacterium]|nr:energy transducer TonB [Prolixibacteraceae bacterium]